MALDPGALSSLLSTFEAKLMASMNNLPQSGDLADQAAWVVDVKELLVSRLFAHPFYSDAASASTQIHPFFIGHRRPARPRLLSQCCRAGATSLGRLHHFPVVTATNGPGRSPPCGLDTVKSSCACSASDPVEGATPQCSDIGAKFTAGSFRSCHCDAGTVSKFSSP